MKTKKVLTANLEPGMVSSDAVYTFTKHLVIRSNTILTPEIIHKLKYYSVKSINVYVTEDRPNLDGPTYFERIQQSEHFIEFKENFTNSVTNFKDQLNDIVIKDSGEVVDDMLHEVESIVSRTRNALHLLDMMQCLRGFDDITYAHSLNVALICNVIGSWLGLPEEEMRPLILCGLLHDIGKLEIPHEIISKPDKLTEAEFSVIRSHPKLGYKILHPKNLDSRIKFAALQHHERYNGSGYPYQLKGLEISKFSSIVSIADVYDAMTANRSYRKGICPFTVIATFEQETDLYEPSLLYLFMRRTIEAYINTEVLLTNGERGKVVLLNQNLLSRPVVVTDTKTYDLSRDFSVDISVLI